MQHAHRNRFMNHTSIYGLACPAAIIQSTRTIFHAFTHLLAPLIVVEALGVDEGEMMAAMWSRE